MTNVRHLDYLNASYAILWLRRVCESLAVNYEFRDYAGTLVAY